MNEQALFDQFAQTLEDNDRSPLTVKSYLEDAGRFARWFEATNGESFAPAAITPTDIREYRNHLLNILRLSANTVNRRLAGISAYCRWAQAQNLIAANPSANIKALRHTSAAPCWLEREQQFALQRAVESYWLQAELSDSRRALWRRRDTYLISFLLHTGLRVAEVSALNLDDVKVDEGSGTVTVRGKGKKVRLVPLNLEARKVVQGWLAIRVAEAATPPLFVSQLGHRLTTRSVQRIVCEMGRLAKIDDLTPHVLRHTFAKRLSESGVGIDRIATLMGHNSIETARIYITPGLQDLARDVEGLVDV